MNKKQAERIYRLNCLASDMNGIYHQAALKLGLTDSVMFVLYLLYENHGSILLHDVQLQTGISKQTLNSAVRKLEKEGIIYLTPENAKAKKIHLTSQGEICVKNTVARLFDAECNLFDDWDETETELYITLMEKYNNSLKKQIEKL